MKTSTYKYTEAKLPSQWEGQETWDILNYSVMKFWIAIIMYFQLLNLSEKKKLEYSLQQNLIISSNNS